MKNRYPIKIKSIFTEIFLSLTWFNHGYHKKMHIGFFLHFWIHGLRKSAGDHE